MKKHIFNRAVSAAVALTFLFTSLVPQYAFSSQEPSGNPKILNAIQEAVPKSAGYITDHNIVSGEKVLVYIQDLHCNPGVQKNISEIISALDENIGVDKVILEGVPEGRVESNVLTALPQQVKYSVVENLLGKGLLTGVELYSVSSNKNNIYGVENWDKYIENIKRAGDLIKVSDNILNSVKPFENEVYGKTKKTLDMLGDLASFKRDDKWYDQITKAEMRYSEPIYKYSNLSAYVNLRYLSGKIDLDKVRKELELYNQELKNNLSYKDYNNIVSKINNQIEYYHAVFDAAESGDFVAFIEKYPNLYLFLSYSIKSNAVNPILVFYDEETYVNNILASETNNVSKFENLLLYRMTSLLNSYISLSMTDSEFGYFSGNLELYKNLIVKKYPAYRDLLFSYLDNKEYLKYYQTNIDRNGIFFDNISKKISDGSKLNVFVSGGFHTSLINDFKKEGISYVLITPVVLENFNSIEVYNRLIEINSSVPRVLRNALNPIPFMLAVFPQVPQQSREAYLNELVNSIVNSSRNYQSPAELKSIVEEWGKNISGIKESDVSVSYDNSVFKIKILEQVLEFKIKNGLIEFKESELFIPKTAKYKAVRIALSEAGNKFSPFGQSTADYAKFLAFRITNKAAYMGMKISGDFYSRVSKRKEDTWAFRFMKLFHRFGLEKMAKSLVGAIAWSHTKAANIANPARQTTLDIDGRRINVVIEGSIELSDSELLEIIDNARNLPRGRASIENIPDTLFFGLIDKSSHLFENYTGIGFIGINKALYKIERFDPGVLDVAFGHSASDILDTHAENLRKIVLKLGLTHEISHEFLGNVDTEETDKFENIRLMQDIAYMINEVKKLHPIEDITSYDGDFGEHNYNEKIKTDYILPYLEGILGGSRFLKRLRGYKLTLDEIIDLIKEKGLSDSDIMHLEDTYLTNKKDKSKDRVENEEKLFTSIVLAERKKVSIENSEFAKNPNNADNLKTATALMFNLSGKLEEILFSTGEYDDAAIRKKTNAFLASFSQGLTILYETLPDDLFERYFNDKTMVKEHGLSHSFDVLSYMLDILAKDKDRLKDLTPKNIKLMVYGAMFHDLSTVISRGNHEHNSAMIVRQMFKVYKDRDMNDEAVEELVKICEGHKKIEDDLKLRPEHSNYIACLLHDADALSAVLELDRIYDVWTEMGNSVFYNKDFTIKQRIKLLKDNNFIDGDAVNDLIRQGYFRRKPNLYITEGAKTIIMSSLQDNILPDYFESKRALIERLNNKKYGKSDVDRMISDIKEVITELNPRLPQKSSDFKDKASAFTLRERFFLLRQMIKTVIFRSKNVNFPKNVFISDIHGGYDRLVAILGNILNVELTPENAKDKIEEALRNSDINAIYIGGDSVDRGGRQLDVLDLLANAAKSGKVRFVEGNHDALLRMNVMGVHLPFYRNYQGILDEYSDQYGNVKKLLTEKIDEDERAKQSGIGNFIPRNYATDRYSWAEKIAEYMDYAKKRQKEKWDKKYEDICALFERTYGERLDPKGKDVLNNPRGVFNDDNLRKWWGMILGRNVGVMVSTGLRAADKMSVNWWYNKLHEMDELRKDYGKSEAEKEAFDTMEKLIAEIIQEQNQKLEHEVEVQKNWHWRVIDAIMYRNYESVEWWALDWAYHSSWGGGSDGLIAQRNIEIEDAFRQESGIWQGPLSVEQQKALDKKKKTGANYLDDSRIQSIGEFFKNNFFFYRRDEYGTYMMHSMLPVDDKGNVSIGRVINGKIEKYENGKRIQGFYYKGKHYNKRTLFKGFEVVASDIRNFDMKNGDLSEILEAFTLTYSIYSDLTTEIKPADIRKKHHKIGFANILQRMGSGVMRLTVGHNPISKSQSIGLHPVEFDGTKILRMIFSIDDEFSEKYAEPKGKGGANIYSGDIGVAYVGFESGSATAVIVGKTYVSKNQFLISVLYDIFKPFAASVIFVYNFYDTGLYNLMDWIKNKLYKQRDEWGKDNTLIINVISESESYGKQHHNMKLLADRNANVVGIELKNMDLIAESERRLLKKTVQIHADDGQMIEIPISFMYKKVKGNGRKNVSYVDIYIGHEAKSIIKNSGRQFEELKDKILFVATSVFIDEIKKPNNPFGKNIHPVNSKRKILMRTNSVTAFDQSLTDQQRASMEGVLVANEGIRTTSKEKVDEEVLELVRTGYNSIVLSDYYMIEPLNTHSIIEQSLRESAVTPQSTSDMLSAA